MPPEHFWRQTAGTGYASRTLLTAHGWYRLCLQNISDGKRLVPAMPPEHFSTVSKPGRKIRPKRNSSLETSNIVNSYTRNNNRILEIKPCMTSQQRNSFFIRTAVEWNHLDDSTINLKSLPAFKAKTEKKKKNQQQKKPPITTNQ